MHDMLTRAFIAEVGHFTLAAAEVEHKVSRTILQYKLSISVKSWLGSCACMSSVISYMWQY